MSRAHHLPIHPSPVHPDNGVLLFLDQDLELPKKTYVNTKTQRSIRWELLQTNYREQRTGKGFRLRQDSFVKLLNHVGFEALVGSGKSKAPEIQRRVSVIYPLGPDLLEPTKARNLAQYGTINRPTMPPSSATEPLRYSIRAPMAASTVQSMARSREGTTAEVDRFFARWGEAQRRESRLILPTYSTTPRSNSVDVDYSTSISRKVLVLLLVIAGALLLVAWWHCQLSVCK